MEDDNNDLWKYGLAAAAAYLLYQNWGSISTAIGLTKVPTFTDVQSLLSYCQAQTNQSSKATLSANGITSTWTCAEWLASQNLQPTAVAAPPQQAQLSAPGMGAVRQSGKWEPAAGFVPPPIFGGKPN